MKLNKTNLNKIIKWTSSKYNVWNKAEVVDRLLNLCDNEIWEFDCGSFAEGAYNGGYSYEATMHHTYLLIVEVNTKKEYRLYKRGAE